MKISLAWLEDFLAQLPTAQAAADALTHAGLPLESIESRDGDSVIDVEVTSNRGDCLSHRGIARELSAILNLPRKTPAVNVSESSTAAANSLYVEIEASDLCPHYTARLIRGVKIQPSPPWMAQRLEAVGIRPINNIVDVTNYVMMELGQPLHAFDFAKIEGGKIIVRRARPGETIVSIDGRKRELNPNMLVIADAKRPVALAGVMGGIDSEVSQSTMDVLLESARFEPLSVRQTARALAMKSESSYRFERGIDPALPAEASLRAAQLILQTAGGELAKGIVQAGSDLVEKKKIALRLPQVRRILGVDLPVQEIIAVFTRLGLETSAGPDRIEVTVPSFRLDINQEIDLVEEAARVLGYDRIPTRTEVSIRLAPPQKDWLTQETICNLLAGGGYFEAVTFSFVSDNLRNDFGPAPFQADSTVRKSDASLRASLLPGLLQAVRFNETSGNAGAKLFEIGAIFPAGKDGKMDEHRTVAWVGGDVRQVRGMVESILARLDADLPVTVQADEHPGFARGAGGRVMWGKQAVGFLGRIDRTVAEKLSLREVPAAAELKLAPLLAGSRHVPQLHPLPRFPAVRRDVSLVVAENLRFEKIESLIRSQNLEFLESIEFVTTYRGKPLEPGQKSVTVTLIFRRPDATLTSEEVEASVQKAIHSAKQQLAATVRG